jgi:hypothetical protein
MDQSNLKGQSKKYIVPTVEELEAEYDALVKAETDEDLKNHLDNETLQFEMDCDGIIVSP